MVNVNKMNTNKILNNIIGDKYSKPKKKKSKDPYTESAEYGEWLAEKYPKQYDKY